jgi:competence protein ComEC
MGWWRGGAYYRSLVGYKNLYGHMVTVKVVAKTDGVYVDNGNLSFDGGSVQITSPTYMKLPGVLKVESRGVSAVFRDDVIEVTGRLSPTVGSRQGSVKYATARLVARRISRLDQLRLQFNAAMFSVLPEPQGSFGLGILIGQRSTLPREVGERLSAVGLTHIIAVSGYNLTIIIRFLGKRFGRSKFQTLTISLFLIVVFVLITGFSASIVRAAIVSMLSLGSWYYGRTIKPLLVLLLSAVITVGWYPVYIWSDIGWYLSFLAFFGVMIIGPLVTRLVWREREPRGLIPLIVESASAQIMAAPFIMYVFKETSLIALPANVLIVPLVPLAMLLSAVAGVGGMFMSQLGPLLAWPAKMLLGYMLQMVDWLSRTPHAVWAYALPLKIMIGFYVLVCLACWAAWIKIRPNYVKITDEGDDS